MSVSAADTTSRVAGRLSSVYTGALADILDGLGYVRQSLSGAFLPLEPGMRMVGPAFPIECRPNPLAVSHMQSARKLFELLSAVPAGHVAVCQMNGIEAAIFGDLSILSLKSRGCAGAVIDGGARDVHTLRQEGFPVVARFVCPHGFIQRGEFVGWGRDPVFIEGVKIAPGDWVVADESGVIVVPQEAADQVAAEAERLVNTEDELRAAIRTGADPLQAFERYFVKG